VHEPSCQKRALGDIGDRHELQGVRPPAVLLDWASASHEDRDVLLATADLRSLAVQAEDAARRHNGDGSRLRQAEADQRQQFLNLLRFAYDRRLGDQLKRVMQTEEQRRAQERWRRTRQEGSATRRFLRIPPADPRPLRPEEV
jgi:hypothetical protein